MKALGALKALGARRALGALRALIVFDSQALSG
jgi:hypothetical protein